MTNRQRDRQTDRQTVGELFNATCYLCNCNCSCDTCCSLAVTLVSPVLALMYKIYENLTDRQTDRQTDRSEPSGWRYKHFKILTESEEMADLLHNACTAIAQGIIPREAIKLLSSSRLIALQKSNGDVRPIAIEETLRQLTAKTYLITEKHTFADFFSPFNMAHQINVGLRFLHTMFSYF